MIVGDSWRDIIKRGLCPNKAYLCDGLIRLDGIPQALHGRSVKNVRWIIWPYLF